MIYTVEFRKTNQIEILSDWMNKEYYGQYYSNIYYIDAGVTKIIANVNWQYNYLYYVYIHSLV